VNTPFFNSAFFACIFVPGKIEYGKGDEAIPGETVPEKEKKMHSKICR
jgi:hypothetical protein